MNTYQFKTNINCGSCVKAVTPFLEATEGIDNWKVDTENPDKILTVEGESLKAEDVEAAIKKAGFDIASI